MKKLVVLHSPMSPESVGDALRRSIDEERRAVFSLSGYEGDRPVLGKVSNNTFQLQKRRFWRNDFASNFYGQLQPEVGGTRIEGHFAMAEWVRIFMWLWLAAVLLLGGAMFIACLSELKNGGGDVQGDPRVGLIVPPAMFLFGLLLPRFGRLLGRSEERYLLDFLQHTLSAQIEGPFASQQPPPIGP